MKKLFLAAAVATVAIAAPANAATVYSTDFSAGVGAEWSITGAGVNSMDVGILGRLDGGDSLLSVSGIAAGASSVTFDLLGFDTIDGAGNCCTDTFTLSHNGSVLFTGTFDMGGGGTDAFTGPAGTTVTGSSFGFGSGGSQSIFIPFMATAGTNTFNFNYGSLQGFGDESWGLDNVGIEGTFAAGGIPEPSTWALMIGGFGMIGGAMRSRRRNGKLAAVAA